MSSALTAAPPSASELFERDLMFSAFDSAQLGLCITDSAGDIVIVNNAACGFLGTTSFNLIGRPARVLGSLSFVTERLDRLFDVHAAPNEQLAHVAGARRLWLQARASTITDAQGEQYRVVSMTDVTQLRMNQETTALEHRQLDAMNCGVVVAEASGDMPIIYCNNRFLEMTGYTQEEVIGRNCRFLQGCGPRQPAVDTLRRAITGRHACRVILRNYRRDGTPFWNELFLSPVVDARGEVVRFIGVQNPVSDELVNAMSAAEREAA
jgi:PAS domain S-box-containing protein